jgi:uncharacterized protein
MKQLLYSLIRGDMIRFFVLISLLLSTTAQAASFDCTKAGTTVEHMICDNPEISKLDDELAKEFQKASRVVSSVNQEQFKVNQRYWLKERNQCADVACLREKYKERVTFFLDVEASAARFSSSKKLYPPYPDVWDREIPLLNGSQALTPSLTGDGEVLITYVIKENGFLNFESATLSFFTGKVLDNFSLKTASWSFASINSGIETSLSDGTKVSLKDMDHRQPTRCPQTLYFYYQIEYPNGKQDSKSVLYLPDEPGTSDISER